MDTCGFAKDSFYFNKACFTEKPMVHILPHWTHKKGDVVRVMAVSNCEEVELFLNGRSLGRKPSDVCETAEWQVEYTPGRISAKAYRNGKCVAKDEQRTAGKPYAIRLMPDADTIVNDGADTAIVNVAVVDKKGIVVPYADDLIRFEIEGEGYVRGVGNGDPNSHESDVLPERKAFHGWCQVLITSRLGGETLTLQARSEGLQTATLPLIVEKVAAPLCPLAVRDHQLTGFAVSQLYAERPNPTESVADNDMNSYRPITIVRDQRLVPFGMGWRIYRVVPQLAQTTSCSIAFTDILCDCMEIYVDGTLLDRVDSPLCGAYETPAFTITAYVNTDIRILMRVGREDGRGAGIGGLVELKYD
jgi:beta-galactosidase